MSQLLEQRLNHFKKAKNADALRTIRVGLERETLRVNPVSGEPSLLNHPLALGSALTHPAITTDYAESLLEFVTSPCHSVEAAADELLTLMRFAARRLDGELLWSSSMPCQFNRDNPIRIAEYGKSNLGLWKHLYRIGLAYRYGKAMQMIAGIHFNFSFADESWPLFAELDNEKMSKEYRTARYLDMMRNIQRSRFIIPYLLGVSPAIGRSFFIDSIDRLPPLDDDTRYLPFGTTLRLSSIGYSNRRCGAYLPLNSLEGYLSSLDRALHTPCPAFEAIGVKVDGEFRQLNTNILQIENEYYASVRPKQPPTGGGSQAKALEELGIGYVEMRLLDVSPFYPIGVDIDTLRFVQTWMTTCFLRESPPISLMESHYSDQNLLFVAMDGRESDLMLTRLDGDRVSLKDGLTEIMDDICAVAEVLGEPFKESVAKQRAKIDDPTLLPSSRVLQELRAYGESFQMFGMRYAQQHTQELCQAALDPALEAKLNEQVATSLADQRALEAKGNVSFEEYLLVKAME